MSICAPLDECKAFLDKYNLTMVQYTKSPLLKTKDNLKAFMKNIYIETLNKNIDEGGEGSVVYFSKFEDNQEEVIQLAKLKTFEYRFLRKLREKIRGLAINETCIDEVLYRIKFEADEILRNEGDSLDLRYLMEFARFVLKLVFRIGKNLNYDDNFASLINSIKKLFQIIDENSKNNTNLSKALNLKLYDYLLSQSEFYSAFSIVLSILINLRKEKVAQDYEENTNNINTPNKLNNSKLIHTYLDDWLNEELEYQSLIGYEKLYFQCLQTKFKKGKVYVFTNCGLIASGKTTFLLKLEKLLKNNFTIEEAEIKVISSDDIRAKMQNEIRNSQNILKDEFALDAVVTKKLAIEFNNQIISHINTSYDKNKLNFIIADKNLFLDTLTKLKK